MNQLKKWNWFLFFVMLIGSIIITLANSNFIYFFDRFMLGLIIGLVFGLLMVFLTKKE